MLLIRNPDALSRLIYFRLITMRIIYWYYHSMSKLIEKEQSIIFIEDSSDTFNFCISIITTEYSMEKSRKYQISCEIDLINKNGAFVKW
jgi:hypothetical protein